MVKNSNDNIFVIGDFNIVSHKSMAYLIEADKHKSCLTKTKFESRTIIYIVPTYKSRTIQASSLVITSLSSEIRNEKRKALQMSISHISWLLLIRKSF